MNPFTSSIQSILGMHVLEFLEIPFHVDRKAVVYVNQNALGPN